MQCQCIVTCRTSLSGSSLPHKMFVGEHSGEKNPTVLLFRRLQDFLIVLSNFPLSQATAILRCSTLPTRKASSPQLGSLTVSTQRKGWRGPKDLILSTQVSLLVTYNSASFAHGSGRARVCRQGKTREQAPSIRLPGELLPLLGKGCPGVSCGRSTHTPIMNPSFVLCKEAQKSHWSLEWTLK